MDRFPNHTWSGDWLLYHHSAHASTRCGQDQGRTTSHIYHHLYSVSPHSLLAMLIWFAISQSMGSAFLLPTAQAVFQNELLKAMRQFVPDIVPLVVLSAVANNNAISSLPKECLGGIVQSSKMALKSTFAIGILFAGMALMVSFFMPWFRYHDASTKPAAEETLSQKVKGEALKKDTRDQNKGG